MNTEVVIVGAGPAGLSAARRLVDNSINVTLLDEQHSAGGQIYRSIQSTNPALRKILGKEYQAGQPLLDVLDAPQLTYINEASVWDLNADGEIFYSRRAQARRIKAQFVILATGAMERPMPFPGWQLPGIMTAGAGQILLKSSSLLPQSPLVLAGSGPLLLLLATQYLRAGMKIDAIVETTPKGQLTRAMSHLGAALTKPDYVSKGAAMMIAIKRHGVRQFRAATELKAIGHDEVQGLKFRTNSGSLEVDCKTLLIHNGVVPNVQFSRLLNLQHNWDPLQRCWQPQIDRYGSTAIKHIAIAGDSAGIAGAEAAQLSGFLAASVAVRELRNGTQHSVSMPSAEETVALNALERHHRFRPFLDALYPPAAQFLSPSDETMICRCEEISAASIREYVRLGCLGPNQTKAFGRCGMGPCQGRFCGLTVSEIIADARGVGMDDVGYYRIRPPVKPVTLAEIATLDDSA